MRSIPAPAGEPSTISPYPPAPTVYPRACGGTVYWLNRADLEEGLSPRLRGNRIHGIRIRREDRSIPAPAGEPNLRRTTGSNEEVYPRACGGTVSLVRPHPPYGGLSPRLRGNLIDMP